MKNSKLSTKQWIVPIIELTRNGKFEESYVLAQYFPDIPEKNLVQCANLVGLHYIAKADILLKTLPLEPQTLVATFTSLFVHNPPDLFDIIFKAIDLKYVKIGSLCLESSLIKYPRCSQKILHGMCGLATIYLQQGDLELGVKWLSRAYKRGHTLHNLIEYARIALTNRRPKTAEVLQILSNKLLDKALQIISTHDKKNYIQIVMLFAEDEQTFGKAGKLLIQLVKTELLTNAEINELFLPLIEKESYFGRIADFLIKLSLENILPVMRTLIACYEKSGDSRYQTKAESILKTFSLEKKTEVAYFAKAVVIVGKHARESIIRLYATRLIDKSIEPSTSFELANLLATKSNRFVSPPIKDLGVEEYKLAMHFIEHAVQTAPSQQTSAIQQYLKLAIIAKNHGQIEYYYNFLAKATERYQLATHFIERTIQTDPSQRIFAIHQYLQLATIAKEYGQTEYYDDFLTKAFEEYKRIPRTKPAIKVDPVQRVTVIKQHIELAMAAWNHDRSDYYNDFLARALNISLHLSEFIKSFNFQTLFERIRFLIDSKDWIKSISEYTERDIDKTLQFLIVEANQEEQRKAFYEVLDCAENQVFAIQTVECLSRILYCDLSISDHEKIRILTEYSSLPQELRNVLHVHLKPSIQSIDIELQKISNLLDKELTDKQKESLLHERHLDTSNLYRIVQKMIWQIHNEQDRFLSAKRIDLLSQLFKHIKGIKHFLELQKTIVSRQFSFAEQNYRLSSPALHGQRELDYDREAEDLLRECDLLEIDERSKKVQPELITRIERHTRIIFPQDSYIHRKMELRIQLTREIPNLSRVVRKVIFDVNANVSHVTLDVNITAPAFALQQTRQSMIIPVNGDSEEIMFLLFPVDYGEQVIEIEFFYQALRVGYVLVKTYIKQRYDLEKTIPNVVTMEDPLDGLQMVQMSKLQDRRTLHVNWLEKEGKFLYTIYSPIEQELGEWEQSGSCIKNEISTYLKELNAFLFEAVSQGDPTEELWESICLNLQSIGNELFEMLIPPQIASCMQDLAHDSVVAISTNEQWIPWELLHDGESFWGERFTLTRYPRLDNYCASPEEHRPISSMIKDVKRIVNVIGGDLPQNDVRKAQALFEGLSPITSVKILNEQPVSVLSKSLPGAYTIHYTCHGHLQPHLLQVAKDRSRIQNLLPQTIRRLPLEPGCFVFANACSSNVPVIQFGKFTTFGWEFYRKGADIFIGTLGSIPTKFALPFAEEFYQTLFFTAQSQTIGQALASAKKNAKKNRNLFWLLYTIYGNPDIQYHCN